MRTAVLVLLVACSSRAAAPDPTEFRKMTPEQKCKVTAPRAARCADELMQAELRAIDPGHAMDEIAKRLEDEPKANAAEATRIHEAGCMSDPHYTESIVACWNLDDCNEFAACVTKTQAPK